MFRNKLIQMIGGDNCLAISFITEKTNLEKLHFSSSQIGPCSVFQLGTGGERLKSLENKVCQVQKKLNIEGHTVQTKLINHE